MKKLVFFMALLPAYASFAQMDSSHSKWYKDSTINYSVVKTLGLTSQEFENLNGRIDGYSQYKALPEWIFSIGMASMVEKGRFVGINGISVGYAMNGNNEKKNATLGYLGISGDVGYNFLGSTSRAKIFPTVGLGLEGFRARFNKDVSGIPFNSLLGDEDVQNDINSVTFFNLFVNYRVGLNFALEAPNRFGTIGLQFGYTGSFSETSWKADYNKHLENAPEDKLSRMFANLYFTKSLKWSGHKM